jgi:hypothetical protein
MSSFFSELGKKLAEQWVALLVLPGLLMIVVAAIGITLGHRAALDWALLTEQAGAWAARRGAQPPVAQGMLLALILLAAAAVGLMINGLGGFTRGCWLGLWPGWLRPVSRALVAHRERRWESADERVVHAREHQRLAADIDRLAARRNRIALARPTRPTWIGDRIAATDARIYHQYQADLQSWWPRLWLILPEETRVELRAARADLDAAAVQASWALGYLLIAVIWWPAALAAAGLGLNGWARGRAAARTYAELLEATVDLHAATLATHLRLVGDDEPFTDQVGAKITRLLRKGT